MHGLGGHRGIIKTRALSFGLYLLAMLTGVVSIPLIVAGPSLVRAWLPDQLDFLMAFYWPAVLALSICFLATLYHVSVPVRTNWTFNLPGATFSLVCWILGSFALRWFLTATAADSRSIYGPLAAPIAVLLWLYLVAIAVLIGAAVNASFDSVFPQKATTSARLELVQRLRQRMAREADEDPAESAGPAAAEGLDSGRAGRDADQSRLLVDPHLGVSRIALPEQARSPWWELGRRLLAAAAILVGTVLIVYFDRTGYRDGNDPLPQLRRRLQGLHLLHDRHAEHDRLRRHRPGQRPRQDGQRVHHHPVPHRLPGAADRYHPGGARVPGTRDVPRLALEEEHGRARRHRRLRHEGPQRRRDPGQQRPGPRGDRRRRQGRQRPRRRARRRSGRGHRRRDPARGAPARRHLDGQPRHHHHRPRRLQRARHADGAPAQPRGLDRLRGARAGERRR